MQDPGLGKDKHSVQNRKSRKDKGLRTEGLAVQRERERDHMGRAQGTEEKGIIMLRGCWSQSHSSLC